MELKEAVELVSRAHQFDDGLDPADTAVWELIAHARRSLDAPQAEAQADPDTEINNLWRAAHLVEQINEMRGVVAELKSAFARNQLDGGVKAAYTHPLYIQAQARLAELHEQMMMVV